MANMTKWLNDLKRPLNKGQCHSFWYQSIPIYDFLYALNSNFCSRTHRLATIHNVTDDDDRRQTDDDDDGRNTIIARPFVQSANNVHRVHEKTITLYMLP